MKVLIIDNFDSFTFNLYQYIGEILQSKHKPFDLKVIRNNEQNLSQIQASAYDRIVISPGPGTPADPAYFGICQQVILEMGKVIPILGVCLGMQGIAHAFGGEIEIASLPMHGKMSCIKHDSLGIFKQLPQNLQVMRYHSLIVAAQSLPTCLEVSAWVCPSASDIAPDSVNSNTQEIMGLRHKVFPIEGIQFHPESFTTEGGMKMLENFLYI